MKTLAALAAPLFLSACVSMAEAGQLMDVSVTDRTTGNRLEVYRHQGQLYVAGVPGNRYAISIKNRTNKRLMSVISVDGVNVISGQTASLSQQGYVLSPWQSTEIAGWRKTTEDVAAFYFTSVDNSYAGRTGRPQNVGVLAVAVFSEEEPLPTPAPAAEAPASARAAAAPRATDGADFLGKDTGARKDRSEAENSLAEEKLGTGHGERVAAPTRYTSFRRASSQPDEIITIYYNSRANLLAKGVIPTHQHSGYPNPFPGAFVPDPN